MEERIFRQGLIDAILGETLPNVIPDLLKIILDHSDLVITITKGRRARVIIWIENLKISFADDAVEGHDRWRSGWTVRLSNQDQDQILWFREAERPESCRLDHELPHKLFTAFERFCLATVCKTLIL